MRAQNRHDTVRWKNKRKTHLADKCRVSKCPICHPHKFKGGNHKGRNKSKYEDKLWKQQKNKD